MRILKARRHICWCSWVCWHCCVYEEQHYCWLECCL